MPASEVLPPELLERIEGLTLVARRIVEGALHGLHRSPFHGLSVEFAQHRQYAPGDELKHLDWKVLARSDRYVIRQYDQETNLRGVIVVDCSGSMAYRTKFQYARTLAAALAYLLVQQGDSVGLLACSESFERQVEGRASPGQIVSICQALEQCAPGGTTNLPSVLDRLAAGLKRRSLVILISDLFDDPDRVISALGRLHHGGHEAIVFQVMDPREITFDLGSTARGVTVIRDMETGAEFEAEPRLIVESVRQEVKQFLHKLDSGARRHGIHLLRTTTDRPHDRVLVRYLHYRHRTRRGGR